MSVTSGVIDRIAPTKRPERPLAGYQTWTDLLFVHWRIPAEELAPFVPKQLTIDTFDGDAWVGLVPFHMSGVRAWWFPAMPGVSRFHETNVRTYVHINGMDPGVWFFSLDASNSLAVRVARWRWQLPYYRSEMQLIRDDKHIRYHSMRLWPGKPGAIVAINAEIGDVFDSGREQIQAGIAAPGTLEHFLVERYILYTFSQNNGLLRGQVHHNPYPLRRANVINLEQNLLQAANITPKTDYQHVLFSEGVDVEIFPLRPA